MEELQIGGKLLGHGVYGCAFMPPLLCRGETRHRNKSYVTKLGRKEDLIGDYNKLKYIADTIPNAEQYFSVPKGGQGLCQPAAKQLEDKEEIARCLRETTAISSYQLQGLRILNMNFVGKTIRSDGAITNRTNLWALGKHLLEGLTLMMVNGIVHGDLHSDNVAIDPQGTVRILDFGNAIFMRSMRDIKERDLENIFSRPFESLEEMTRYNQEPPEVPLYNAFFNNQNLNTVVEGIFVNRPKLVRNLQFVLGITKDQIRRQVREYRSQTSYFEENPDLVNWWKHHWHTYDAWSGGYLLLGLLMDLHSMGVQFDGGRLSKMKEALRGLLNFNCIKRFNPAQALAVWDSSSNPIIVKYAKKWL